MDPKPMILLAAGGTGGHLFPAEALGVELIKRGFDVRLVTDSRALRYSGLFSKDMIDVVASETARGWFGDELFECYLRFKRSEMQAVDGMTPAQICARYAEIY